MGRQAPHEHGGADHAGHAKYQRALASVRVAYMTGDDPAERTTEECQSEYQVAVHQIRVTAAAVIGRRGEEDLGYGIAEITVHGKIVPLQYIAQQACYCLKVG